MYTLDQIVREALSERGFSFRESEHVGLRADPPTIRVRLKANRTWAVLDVSRPLAAASDLETAMQKAREILVRTGFIYVVGLDGLIQTVEHVRGSHAVVDGQGAPKGAAEEPAAIEDLDIEEVKKVMGFSWMNGMKAAAEQESGEAVADGVREAYHTIHALHPVLPQVAQVIQTIIRAAGF